MYVCMNEMKIIVILIKFFFTTSTFLYDSTFQNDLNIPGRHFFWLFPPEDSTLDRNVVALTLFGKNSISNPGSFCQRYGRQIMTSGRIEIVSLEPRVILAPYQHHGHFEIRGMSCMGNIRTLYVCKV